jgi:AsmA protein
MKNMSRIIVIVAVVLVALVAAAVFVLPSLIPAEVYRAQIEARASEALGRSVSVSGDVNVAVIPSLQARAGAVTIANAEGFEAVAFAEVEELRAKLALLPLLARRVEIREFVLVRPAIALETDRTGRNNWTFATSADAAPSASGGFARRPGALPFDAALGDVRVVDGRASYVDRAAGVEHTIEALNIRLAMPGLGAPLEIEGDFLLDGDAVRLEARLDSLRSFFDGEDAPFFAELDAGALRVEADGRFEPGEAVSFAGDVRLASSDLKALAAKAGAALPPGEAYRTFELSGRATGNAERVAFENAALAFDDIAGTGGLVVDLTGARPNLTGTLALGALDVTPYIDTGEAGGGGQGGGGVPPWSEEPIDFGPLEALDADLTLTVESLKALDLSFGRSSVHARLVGGRLQIDVEELNAYEGTGQAQVVVDASGARPQVALTADLANLQAQPFLAAAAKFDRLIGAGGGTLRLTGSGGSQAEIMRSLDGTGGFDFKDGAIQGVNIAAALRGIDEALQGRVNLDAFSSSASTDFTDLLGQFTIEDGVARLRDFRLASPLVRVTGSGDLDIANQTIELHLEPRAVATIEGQGGAGDLSGIGIPLLISGSWGAVTPGIDQERLQQLLAQRAVDAVGGDITRGIDDALGQGAGDVLRGALGLPAPRSSTPPAAPDGDAAPATPDEGAAEADDEEEDDPAERLIRGIFGDQD